LWASEYQRRAASAEGNKPRFHCERLGDQQVRLTQYGELAKEDALSGEVGQVLDFVHRRTLVFVGRVVRGHGKAERIRVHGPSPAPAKVEVVNPAAIAAAFAPAFAPAFAALMDAYSPKREHDLIPINVAVEEYYASERTIRSKVKEGKLTDHRPAGHAKNEKLMLSRSELDRLFPRRQQGK
jgi:hypothetical protein